MFLIFVVVHPVCYILQVSKFVMSGVSTPSWGIAILDWGAKWAK